MQNIPCTIVFIALFFTAAFCSLSFQPAWPGVSVFAPVDLDYQSGNVYATSITGQIYSFANSDAPENEASVFFDINSSETPEVSFFNGLYYGSEDGLTSSVFHPEYPSVPKFYTFYSSSSSSIQITAWTVVDGAVDYTSGDVLFNINKAEAAEARLGGDMQFDEHGDLYISIGDSSNTTAAQDLNNLLGKVLRITPNANGSGYSIPSSNPFASTSVGKSEVFSRGYRNPRKIAFGKANKLFVGDVGDQWDEINKVEKGNNNGWNLYDGCQCIGTCPPHSSQYKFPFYQYTSDAPHALTLGVYYPKSNDDESIDSLESRIIFADLYSGNVYSIQSTDTNDHCETDATFIANAPALISTFLRIGYEVYLADVFGAYYGNPSFYRLVRTGSD